MELYIAGNASRSLSQIKPVMLQFQELDFGASKEFAKDFNNLNI